MTSRRRSALDIFTSFGLAGFHTSVTLWYRLSMMAAAPSPEQGAEIERMISEKATAMFEGGLSAQAEAMRLAGAAVSGRLQPSDFEIAPVSIAAAGLRPAFRLVRSNSRRLRRGRA
jgi:hypothetical protein